MEDRYISRIAEELNLRDKQVMAVSRLLEQDATVPFIARYRNTIINIHPADTALYQGIHGYEWAFQKKLEATQITVHFVDEGVDTGQVLAQREVDLRGAKTLEEVEHRGLRVEHAFYSEVLRDVFTGKLSV